MNPFPTLKILAFAAHPDDVELAASGTLMKHINMGHACGIIDLTRGELGTRGSAELRDQEAAESAKIMGLAVRDNLNLGDGFFEENEENLIKVIKEIRKYQPQIVLANAVSTDIQITDVPQLSYHALVFYRAFRKSFVITRGSICQRIDLKQFTITSKIGTSDPT